MPAHRIGIMGCGPRSRAFAAVVASLDDADLVVCADDAATASWQGHGLHTLILSVPRLDHADLAAAVQQGVDVLVDPPLARGVVDARRAVRAVEGSPERVRMAFDWRFEPLVRLLRALMPRTLFAHVSLAVDPGPPQAPRSVQQAAWSRPHHALDLLMHLFGGPPAEIVADGGPLPASSSGTPTASVPPRADALVADLWFDRERHASLTVAGGGADPDLGPVVLDMTDGVTRARVWSNWTAAEILPLDGRSLDPPPLTGVRVESKGRAVLARTTGDGDALRALLRAFTGAPASDAPLVGAAAGARVVALTRAVLASAASGRTQTLRAA